MSLYYSEFDDESGLYCVFREEGGDFAFASFSSAEEAEEVAGHISESIEYVNSWLRSFQK